VGGLTHRKTCEKSATRGVSCSSSLSAAWFGNRGGFFSSVYFPLRLPGFFFFFFTARRRRKKKMATDVFFRRSSCNQRGSCGPFLTRHVNFIKRGAESERERERRRLWNARCLFAFSSDGLSSALSSPLPLHLHPPVWIKAGQGASYHGARRQTECADVRGCQRSTGSLERKEEGGGEKIGGGVEILGRYLDTETGPQPPETDGGFARGGEYRM